VSQLITNKNNDFALAGSLGEQVYTYSSTIENSRLLLIFSNIL
jgi:hypothetical protein